MAPGKPTRRRKVLQATVEFEERGPEPLIGAVIEVGRERIDTLALIDSGATSTIVPYDLIAPLVRYGFDDLRPQFQLRGIGGSILVAPIDGKLRVAWTTIQRFLVAQPGKLDRVLLGRNDFFSVFDVSFRWAGVPEFEIGEPVT